MTRYHRMGVIAAAVAAVLAPDVHSQTGTARLLQGSTVLQSCTYTSLSVVTSATAGVVDIQCGVQTTVDTIGFTQIVYPPVAKTATGPSVPINNVNVNRQSPATDVAAAIKVRVKAGSEAICATTTPVVDLSWAAGLGGPLPVAVTATGFGTCQLELFGEATGAGVPAIGARNASITVQDASSGSTAIPPECVGKTPPEGPDHVMHTTLKGASQSDTLTSVINRVHSWPVPKRNGVIAATGATSSVAYPGTPGDTMIEWSISKCRGDTEYYKLPEAAVTTSRGGVIKPCGAVSGVVGGGVRWSNSAAVSGCIVPAGEQWYINYRIVGGPGCPAGSAQCTIVYNWN